MLVLRRWIVAAAVLFALAFAAQAQVAIPGGNGGAGNLICQANVSNPTFVRAEGYSELVGDIFVICTGGPLLAPGTTVPTANITVSLSNTFITSRQLNNGASEALLLIDEPNAPPGFGAGFDFLPCDNAAAGAGPGGCAETVGTATPSSGTPVYSAVGAGGAPYNAFHGVVNANQVVFNGVPILPPVTAGYVRVFRISNVRAAVANIGGGNPLAAGGIQASVTLSNGLLVQAPPFPVASILSGLTTSVRNAANTADGSSVAGLTQCVATPLSTTTAAAVLRFTEGFASAFKTRVAPTASYSGAATPPGSISPTSPLSQNVPGVIFAGSESGLVLTTGNGTAGLADFGTRLKATFTNIPPGLTIYVSTTNINPAGNTGVAANASTLNTLLSNIPATTNGTLAALVTSETATSGATLPLANATQTLGGGITLAALTPDANGTATATWEVLQTNPAAQEAAEFAVYYSFAASAGAPPVTPASVSLSYAPAVASYSSSNLIPRFAPSSNSTAFASIGACPTTSSASLAASPNPSTFGQAVTLTATVGGSGGVGTPTGTVTFKDGATILRAVTLVNGQAAMSISSLAAGTHSLTAVYSGDGTYPAATSSAVPQVVNRASTATALSMATTSVAAGNSAAFVVTVSSAAGTPTGSVTLRDGAVTLGAANLDAGGQARFVTPPLDPGDHAISATYSGSGNFLGSVSASQRLTVNRLSTSISTPVVRSGSLLANEILTIAVNVSSDNGSVGGSVTFRDGPASLGDASIDGSGAAVITPRLGFGRHLITAQYNGDLAHDSAFSGTLNITMQGSSTVTLASSANPIGAGAAVTFTATVAAGSNASGTPTGTVSFSDGGTALGTAALDSLGHAIWTAQSGLAAGDHSITASYGGDANFVTSSSAAVVEHVSKTATVTTLSESSTASGFSLTAVVTASAGAPTGTVQFLDVTAGGTLGSAPLSNGSATVSLAAPLPTGHMIQASYGGDSTFAASNSAQAPLIAAANGFSFSFTMSPDSIGSIFGSGLAGAAQSASAPLPATLGGVTVQIIDANGAGHAALLYYVSPGQINFVLPADVPAGSAKLVITTPSGSFTISVTIAPAAPALTSADGSGSGLAAAQIIRVHADGSQDVIAVTSTPIAFGADRLFLILYGTGLRHLTGPVACSVNGQQVSTLFAGAQGGYPGLDQVNLELPRGLSGKVSISCGAAGLTSNTVTLNLQ